MIKYMVIPTVLKLCITLLDPVSFSVWQSKGLSSNILRTTLKYNWIILKTSKFTKKCMASGRRVGQLPDCHTFLCKFWYFQMALSQSKLAWLTPNLGILWISVCSFWLCESIVANPIIYRLVPRPSRFETRQWSEDSMSMLVTDTGTWVCFLWSSHVYHTLKLLSPCYVAVDWQKLGF